LSPHHVVFTHAGCLQIEKATHANDGFYTLVVWNELGITNRTIEAQVHTGMLYSLPCSDIHSFLTLLFAVTANF
jgi:hypothetical protein